MIICTYVTASVIFYSFPFFLTQLGIFSYFLFTFHMLKFKVYSYTIKVIVTDALKKRGIIMNKSLFWKYIRNYFAILGISLLLLTPVYISIYRSAEERVLKEAYNSLWENVNNLDDHVLKTSIMADLLSKDEYVIKLAERKGEAKSGDAFPMLKAQEKFESFFLLRTENFKEYLIFKDNDIVIGKGEILSSQKHQHYEKLGQSGKEYTDFLQTVFENNKSVYFMPTDIRSRSEGILGIVKIPEKVGVYKNMALIFQLDREMLLGIFGMGDTHMNIACITDENGQILYHVNTTEEDSLQQLTGTNVIREKKINLNGLKYTLIRVKAENGGLYWNLGISEQTIRQEIASINRIIVIYIVAAVLGICIICALCAWRSTQKMSDIMEEIESYRESMTNSMLTRLLLCGVYSSEEKQEIAQHLVWDMEFYCVVCISMIAKQEKELVEGFAYIDDLLAEKYKYFDLNIGENEKSYIIKLEQSSMPDSGVVAEELMKMLTLREAYQIGISGIGTGIENVQLCYQQAKLMSRQGSDNRNKIIKTYREPVDVKSKIFRMNLGNRLYDLIYAAEKESVQALFDKIRSYAGRISWHQEAEMMQFFFEIQNPIAKVWDELKFSDKLDKDILYYHTDKTIMELVDSLKNASLYLCDIAYQNQNELKNGDDRKNNRYDMLELVEKHYADKDMCVSYAASLMGLSEKYFAVLFKEQTGRSFGSFVEARRLKQAEVYLTETDMSMAQVADKVGYNTLDTFYKSFKKVYGLAPGKWKEINSKNKS